MRRFGGTRERNVSVKIEAPDNVLAIAVEIEIPTGVKVGSISDGGIWDADNRKVKWGPFTQALSRSVSFSYGASGSARSQDTRSTGFKGTISFDGLNQPFVVK
jgi:hypothetical protein